MTRTVSVILCFGLATSGCFLFHEKPGGAAGAGGGGIGGAAGFTTDDVRERQMQLADDIPGVTGVGWRESETPLCAESKERIGGYAIWSDDRGVFVLSASHANGSAQGVDGVCVGVACQREGLWWNDGTGWTLVSEGVDDPGPDGAQLRGIPNGPLLAWGSDALFGVTARGCGFLSIEPESRDVTCLTFSNSAMGLLSVVGERGYAAATSGEIFSYDGAQWGPLDIAPTRPLSSLWGGADGRVLAGAADGFVLERDMSGTWTTHDTRTLDAISDVWGEDDGTAWAGTESGRLMHYDGHTWADYSLPDLQCGRTIEQLQGLGDSLFVRTRFSLVRITPSSTEVIVDLPCTDETRGVHLLDMWGLSETEVFLLVDDQAAPEHACGSAVALVYDGTSLNWF